MSNKVHYFLVSGTVFVQYVNPENPEDIGVMPVPIHTTLFNAVAPHFGVQMLKQAHTALQLQYRHKTKDHEGVVLDVVFNSVSSLGYMTPEEFEHCEEPTKDAVADLQAIIDKNAVTRHGNKKK